MLRHLSLLQMLVILLVLLSPVGQRTRTARAQGTTYTDPFAYCTTVRTIDAPDARYVGPAVPETIARGLRAATAAAPDTPLDRFVTGTSWRCMDGQVYACTVGANLPCAEQATTSRTPTGDMTTYCQAHANADALPGFVTGRATVYAWRCVNGVATPGRELMQVDARGFIANIWYAIDPPGAAGTYTLPQTGGAGLFGGRSLLLVALGVLLVLLGLLTARHAAIDTANP